MRKAECSLVRGRAIVGIIPEAAADSVQSGTVALHYDACDYVFERFAKRHLRNFERLQYMFAAYACARC
jgi:hypothetical protein